MKVQNQINSRESRSSTDAEVIARREVLEDESQTIAKRLVAALESESGEPITRTAEDDPEIRERNEITGKASLSDMVGGIVAGRASSGAESEAQSAWGIQGDQIPVAMLGIEQRVINAPDSSGSGTNPIMAYVFGAGIAQVANIGRPMIPSGQAVFPSFTSALPATRPAAGAANTDQDPGMRGQLLTPQKVQANTSINVEDRGLSPGLGQAVAAHLADAVAAGLDLQALLDNNGFLDETSGPLTPPLLTLAARPPGRNTARC